MTWKGSIAGALAAAAGLLMAAPSVATLERANRASTSVTISSKVPAFSGSVRSKVGVCRRGRRVELLKRTSGGDPKLLGRDTSNSSGDWAVRLDNVRPGAYFARSGQRTKERHGTTTVCASDRSRVVVVD